MTPRPHPLSAGALALVAAGGAVGGLARYGLGRAFPTAPDAFPTTTLVINVVGAFLLGALLTVLARRGTPDHRLRLVLGVGALGAFTTFSTLAVDVVRLGRSGRPGRALAAATVSVVAGIAAVVAGHRAGRIGARARGGTRAP
ncbi:MAG: fluoride efflux transporter FluC [Actinomycetota bacterium]